MSETFAVQLTAVATLALAALALATAILALLAWRKQSREVRDQGEMLRLQAEEFKQLSADREREAVERRRAQAVQIYMWRGFDARIDTGPKFARVHLRNSSQQPVHSALFGWIVDGQIVANLSPGSGPVMPGETIDADLPYPHLAGREVDIDPVAAFCDRGGTWWRTREDGRLEELSQPPSIPAESLPADLTNQETSPDVGEQSP